jgi:FixJ family two-component response regulator/signal transduction histidine kinase
VTAAILRPGADKVPLLEQLAFERLLADLMARLASVTSDRIVTEIEHALGELVDFLAYDRCTYCEFAADGALHVSCSAAVGDLEPLPRGAYDASLPWFLSELRAGRTVALATIPEDLPLEASAEVEHCRRIGLRSHLSIPLRLGGRVNGVLSFAGLHSARTWPDEVITRLSIIGEVFTNAMSRARFEEEALRLRSRLWHADRVARIGALAAAIAHEINQPLTAILSNAQAGLRHLDRNQAMPEDVRAILEAVVRDDKRAAETIRTMRALLRKDASARVRMDLAVALREVLQLLAGELGSQGIRIEAQFGTDCCVVADKAQIEQVALNLILNAAAAMQGLPRDHCVLRVSVSRGEGRVVAELSDSGMGITAEPVDTVFEPFWTTREEGLGLGLAICRSIVEAHGGTIRAARNPDRGATFRFELPRGSSGDDIAQDQVPAGKVAPGEAARTGGAGPTVCVVDDDDSVREGLMRLIAAAGWNVVSYASASEFLKQRSVADFACLVLDVQMPGMSGLELQQRLSSQGASPPVVFLTAHGDLSMGIDAMKLGAVDFLPKPIDADALVAAVGRALARHARERGRASEQAKSQALLARLSAREREILEQVVMGRLNKQIAADLDIAEQTVKQHRGRVMEKMEVRSVAELVRVCEAAGLFATSGVASSSRPHG